MCGWCEWGSDHTVLKVHSPIEIGINYLTITLRSRGAEAIAALCQLVDKIKEGRTLGEGLAFER
jgi:hypothetical protein